MLYCAEDSIYSNRRRSLGTLRRTCHGSMVLRLKSRTRTHVGVASARITIHSAPPPRGAPGHVIAAPVAMWQWQTARLDGQFQLIAQQDRILLHSRIKRSEGRVCCGHGRFLRRGNLRTSQPASKILGMYSGIDTVGHYGPQCLGSSNRHLFTSIRRT